MLIPLDRLVPPQRQPRSYLNQEAMQVLVASIRQYGILNPLMVRPVGAKYEVVAGERRYRAAVELGLTSVPVTVREMTDEQAIEYALVENLLRSDMNPVEETESILQLLAFRLECDLADVTPKLYRVQNEVKGKITRNVSGNSAAETVEQVFASLGRNWQSFIRTRLPLLKLPLEILEALRQGQIEYTKAKTIAQLKDESERKALLEEAITESLSLSQIRERIKAKQLPSEREELQGRIEAIPKKIKKLKAWDDPDKRYQLESLLKQIEAVLSEE